MSLRGVLWAAAALLIPACGRESPPAAETELGPPPAVPGPDTGEQPLGSGQPPYVTIVSPGTGTTVQEGATISVQAVARSPSAVIVVAQLFDNGRAVADRSVPPFIFPLGGLTPGAHVLTVAAVDIQGLTAVSEPVTVFVVNRS